MEKQMIPLSNALAVAGRISAKGDVLAQF